MQLDSQPQSERPIRTSFEGPAEVDYGFLVVLAADSEFPLSDAAMVGQRNGICCAQTPGSLLLRTGTYVGVVPLQLTLWEAVPSLGGWGEIVEASFTSPADVIELPGAGPTRAYEFDLPAGTYRVRWNANSMDAGAANVTSWEQSPAPDSYELMLWPAPYEDEEIIRSTSAHAAFWHAEAARTRD